MPVSKGRADPGGAPSGTAGGDLAESYPDPTVIALQSTDGPTRMALGSIVDGQVLQRDAAAVIGFDAIGGPNSAWEEDAGDDLLPKVDLGANIGSDAQRVEFMRTRSAAIVGGAGSPTFGAGQGGLIAGTMTGSGGTEAMSLGGAAYPSIGLLGKATAYAGGSASLDNPAGGGMMVGSAFAAGGVGAVAEVHSYGSAFGAFTGGYAYAYGAGSAADIYGRGIASFTWGFASAYGGAATVSAAGGGSVAIGAAESSAALATVDIVSTGAGSFAQGFASSTAGSTATKIESVARGSMARGMVSVGGLIESSGFGSFASGYATGVGAIVRALGAGSFAIGAPIAGEVCIASAARSAQFGVGTNTEPNSLQVGSGGIRLNGTAGVPVALQNGDIWPASGYVYIRSGGVTVKIT